MGFASEEEWRIDGRKGRKRESGGEVDGLEDMIADR